MAVSSSELRRYAVNVAHDVTGEGGGVEAAAAALNYITHNPFRASTATARMLRFRCWQPKIAVAAEIRLPGLKPLP